MQPAGEDFGKSERKTIVVRLRKGSALANTAFTPSILAFRLFAVLRVVSGPSAFTSRRKLLEDSFAFANRRFTLF